MVQDKRADEIYQELLERGFSEDNLGELTTEQLGWLYDSSVRVGRQTLAQWIVRANNELTAKQAAAVCFVFISFGLAVFFVLKKFGDQTVEEFMGVAITLGLVVGIVGSLLSVAAVVYARWCRR